jgi:hypothetical protein
MTNKPKGNQITLNKIPSNVLQAIQFSLRKGYSEMKKKKASYERDRVLNKDTAKLDVNLKLLEVTFNAVNKELRQRRVKDRLKKCYGDCCHSKCSDNCTCGWCLLRKGWEALI